MNGNNILKLRKLGIDTYLENIIYMRHDCPVCVSEGFKALTRVVVKHGKKEIIATLNVIHSQILDEHEASLSDIAIKRLDVNEGDVIEVDHLDPLTSMSFVRSKIYGNKLNMEGYTAVVNDISHGKYSDVQLAAFLSACSGKERMDVEEICFLTKAMIDSGERMTWKQEIVVDKHSIGGLPGNRTTPLVVSIVAAAGLCIPKTSSRAITSPAGTADTMEVITNVNLTLDQIKEVVDKENGCMAWGGSVKLSPADDILIRVERALDIDSEAQVIASVLSKKAATGSNIVIIDVPVGLTAKVRTWEDAQKLKQDFESVGKSIDLLVKVIISDGSQPIGRGIGPALEAMDLLSVLKNEAGAPQDLKERAMILAGEILELGKKATEGKGVQLAKKLLENGMAWQKFLNICNAQGRFTEPQYAEYKEYTLATHSGTVTQIDNRKLAMVAKLAGAPLDKKAGVVLHTPLGTRVTEGQLLLTVYAESAGGLHYALSYLGQHSDIIKIENSRTK